MTIRGRKEKIIGVRLTLKEYELLILKARAYGVTISEYIRRLITR